MQIFTEAMVHELLRSIADTAQVFFVAFFFTAWQAIVGFFPALTAAFLAGDWSQVVLKLVILLGLGAILVYYVRKGVIAMLGISTN